MGSTTWDYFVPYDDDAAAALHRLRGQVFREERYERFTFSCEDLAVIQGKPRPIDPNASAEEKHRIQQQDAFIRLSVQIQEKFKEYIVNDTKSKLDYSKKPKTIDELLEEQGESGTHSILDIQRISDTPESGAVSPMRTDRLVKIFGTDKPTRKMVESKLGDCREAPDLVEDPLVAKRWQGIYFTLYRDGKPAEIFFMGTSGD